MEKDSKIYIAGHHGLVGSNIMKRLREKGYTNVIGRTRQELDLTNQDAVNAFFEAEQPEYVVLAAAKVGGILANNTYPADFIMRNLQIQVHVIDAAYRQGVKKLLFLGSSCIYPRMCPQPIKEEYLLTGELEKTNEAYALAKISGLKMCYFYKQQYGANFISVMPTNLYGPGDNFGLTNSHVLPALLRKMHEAKESNADTVEIWGTGNVLREFLYIDDMADGCIFLLENYDGADFVNLGTGKELTIRQLAELIKRVVGFKGQLVFNPDKPDGTPRKLLDVSKMKELGWQYKVELEDGIRRTYQWFLEHQSNLVMK
ncbi:GDP-L-fucose synthase [Sporolactobacillus sp. CQH2019]|uniref:GDP-L-fucose synthase family protein n=1 Tax=Sporolactobacillus sp. CQH2019 TaxID=3023512 RepID=UPI002368C320|nr:GDP-L-fucose synthase [Sporolactobacillus sp. CQH2019]MDD9148836.1 GDP-L-fucose synthase [Sporolactobacillus sp. CQH2019]